MNAPVTALQPGHEMVSGAQGRQPGWAAGMRLGFLHIPKTAGTAFGAALAQHFAEHEIASTSRMAMPSGAADPLLPQVATAFRALGIGSHLDHDQLDAIAAGLPAGERLFTVTVLRDPRARLISQYRYWRRKVDASLADLPEEQRNAFLAARNLTLTEFLEARIPYAEAHFRNLQARMICGLGTAEVMDEATLLATARANLAAFDVVGTTDAVDEALARIAEAYGWAPPDPVRPLNVAPSEAPLQLSAEAEALVAEYTGIDQLLWEEARGRLTTQRPSRRGRSFHRPDPALVATLLDGGLTRFRMADALDGQGWHVREGEGETLSRWTGPSRRATIRLRAPQLRQLELSIHLVSVLDWAMVEHVALTLDGVPPSAPPQVEHGLAQPILRARFDLPNAGDGFRMLAIEVPFTKSHKEIDPIIDDARQKGLAIGDMVLAALPETRQGPATLGALFWPGQNWSDKAPADLLDLVRRPAAEATPPPCERNLVFDLPLLRGLLDLLSPDHVWAAARRSILEPLERGRPLAMPARGGSLAILATLFEIAGRGAPVAQVAARHEAAVLLLPCAEDFRLRQLAASPLLAPFLHIIGCTNAILVANLAAMRRDGGQGRVEAFLLLLERISATLPEKLAVLPGGFGADYMLQQLEATLRGAAALNAGGATPRDVLATLMLDRPPPPPTPQALQDQARQLMQAPGTPITLVDPDLTGRLAALMQHLATQPPGEGLWHAALVAQECAFRITALLAGWARFDLGANRTGQLALRLRTEAPRPVLYPKPAKPFGEYIDFYKAEAAAMGAHAPAPDLVTRLDTLRGGLDHVTRLNQAAREIEVALRLLGDRYPGEEILWVDAGCSYGVIMNAVQPPQNIQGRCSFLGFDFNAPAIRTARVVAGNLGLAHCRFEVGDVAEARSLAAGRRIHLITAFEVLEHCPDPLAVLSEYRSMEPGMLVVGSPLAELQSIFPAEQHIWAFNARGFAAMAEAAGFSVIGLNQRQVGAFVGGHDWVTVTATTSAAGAMGMV
ncbi:methyltransferase domain-containing protein [Falsiroseomonas tokyonensis]|uniref:Methyltransferase domain-containing protein n=1 Tax=Falsiroseomonas tokyonensis TaxID=430521 RepID=A0ABV7BSV1_9PROT|nr:methyltransferase domain-containing protein [Falsiroseomonas tokyonensis]MBU8538256.1 methyltransferase domain-containing protein [Falsiroseomonas tokyonensis]